MCVGLGGQSGEVVASCCFAAGQYSFLVFVSVLEAVVVRSQRLKLSCLSTKRSG